MCKIRLGVSVLALVLCQLTVSSQARVTSPEDALVDLLAWGADLGIDPNMYRPELQAQIQRHLERWKAYRSKRARPSGSSELEMVYLARVRYERRLVAASDDPRAPALAASYVDDLAPCYESEGFHDCPEREAMFADGYQSLNQGGPFSEYLPFLAAHRWLCTAEAYEYEKRPEAATRSRGMFAKRIST
ncbi:MAG: hypothetical protein EHM89_13175, partial [Acidobacteria bacterium]